MPRRPRLRPQAGPRLPKAIPAKGLFVLISPPDLAIQDADPAHDAVDGPLDPTQVVAEPDGALVFLTEGFPYRMKVAREEGDVLWLETGDDEGGPTELPYRVWPVAA